jgi:hypothetical protein
MHACRKVVSPLIVVGENDAVQMGDGWYEREKVEGFYVRRSHQRATAHLMWLDGARHVAAHVCGLAERLGPVALSVQVGGQTRVFELDDDAWHDVVVDLPPDMDRTAVVDVTFVVDRARVPGQIDGVTDQRELGIMVRQIGLQ